MAMHFIMKTGDYPRAFNILGSLGVAAFLFISGFGINESYKKNGLKQFWHKRIVRVMLPCWIVFLVTLPFKEKFSATQFFHNLIFTGSDLWFIDYIVRWYAVYWVSRRIIPEYTKYALLVFSIYNIFQEQLYSEQAFSFTCGYIVSEYYEKISCLQKRTIAKYSSIVTIYGIAFLLIKELPSIQAIKGSLLFNIILLNIKLPMAMPLIVAPYICPIIKKILRLKEIGKISYELYIVHYNFMPYITGYLSIAYYTAVSAAISCIFYQFNKLLKNGKSLLYALSGIVYTGICYILMCKYSMRATDRFAYICVTYLLMLVCVVFVFSKNIILSKYIVKGKTCVNKKWLFIAFLLFFTVAMLAVQYHFDPLQNNVDRWSAIAYPLDYLFNGRFPYAAPTHLGGNSSPFPIWILFHTPFYLLGNVGLSEIFTAILFICSVKYAGGYKEAMKAAILLFICINLWYEVSVRSDMISNFLLLGTFFNILMAKGVTFEKRPLFLSAIAGLWLSTRLSTAFPLFIMFFPYYLRIRPTKMVAVPIIAIATFTLTFLPLIIWDANELFFAINSPFSLQFRQGSPVSTVIILFVAILMALRWKGNGEKLYLYSALILILVPVASYGYNMYINDRWTDIFNSAYDITYLDAALPFCITALSLYCNKNRCVISKGVSTNK